MLQSIQDCCGWGNKGMDQSGTNKKTDGDDSQVEDVEMKDVDLGQRKQIDQEGEIEQKVGDVAQQHFGAGGMETGISDVPPVESMDGKMETEFPEFLESSDDLIDVDSTETKFPELFEFSDDDLMDVDSNEIDVTTKKDLAEEAVDARQERKERVRKDEAKMTGRPGKEGAPAVPLRGNPPTPIAVELRREKEAPVTPQVEGDSMQIDSE